MTFMVRSDDTAALSDSSAASRRQGRLHFSRTSVSSLSNPNTLLKNSPNITLQQKAARKPYTP
jgi:hypothetical protein